MKPDLRPHLDLTVQAMRTLGAVVEVGNNSLTIDGTEVQLHSYVFEMRAERMRLSSFRTAPNGKYRLRVQGANGILSLSPRKNGTYDYAAAARALMDHAADIAKLRAQQANRDAARDVVEELRKAFDIDPYTDGPVEVHPSVAADKPVRLLVQYECTAEQARAVLERLREVGLVPQPLKEDA